MNDEQLAALLAVILWGTTKGNTRESCVEEAWDFILKARHRR